MGPSKGVFVRLVVWQQRVYVRRDSLIFLVALYFTSFSCFFPLPYDFAFNFFFLPLPVSHSLSLSPFSALVTEMDRKIEKKSTRVAKWREVKGEAKEKSMRRGLIFIDMVSWNAYYD